MDTSAPCIKLFPRIIKRLRALAAFMLCAATLICHAPAAGADAVCRPADPAPNGTEYGAAAEDITAECAVTAGGKGARRLTDGDRKTKYALAGGTVVSIAAGERIGGVYVIWDRPPGEWTLDAGGGALICGQHGFIHEFVPLAEPAYRATLTVNAAGGTLCDIYAFTEGAPPDWVQTWRPPWEQADILVIPTHADDEYLWFGGIMPYYGGELGYRVQVAYFTHHWRHQPRMHELLDGLWTVGIAAYPVISKFRDVYVGTFAAGLEQYPLERSEGFHVELLRRFRPAVVVGHAENGESGHNAHRVSTYALKLAVEAAADPAQYPETAALYGVWDTPKLYLHLYPENQVIMDWDIPLSRFGGRTALEMAAAGMACHSSQSDWAIAIGSRKKNRDCRIFGLYRTTVGPDTTFDDLLENIDFKRQGPREQP